MRKLTNEEFIQRANKLHCGKYDYSKVEYVNSMTKDDLSRHLGFAIVV